ncbi:hypothetical protein [Sphingomonas sp. TREG-RG-20F-R18-01]|uniref:hypothetical protein n=1 Tax=Sphingomonas sp. TREG-RG-20F-R18-01 TaxID=2914982 RepID=UPI001F5A30D8|nr:hypothetical protein [Sphingomonas sp. TREG-RG-20F-R18-01]
MLLADALRGAALCAWLFCLACLSPAVWRILRRRGRYLDPIWGLVFMLAINRVTFITRLSLELSHLTAGLLAIAMGAVTLSFQRHDR